MKAVIQRVSRASVTVDGEIYNSTEKGLLVFLGVMKGDTMEQADDISQKIIDLRIFEDENGKMNLSVKEIGGEIMVISQFTLCSDNNKSGNRPSFIFAEEPDKAKELYEYSIGKMKEMYEDSKIKGGVFAARMKIELINDGPVTIILER